MSEIAEKRRALLDAYLARRGTPAVAEQGIPRRPDGPADLSFAQQRIWFLQQLAPESPAYNVANAFRLTGALNFSALHTALGIVVRRHEILRCAIDVHDGRPWMRILPVENVELPVVDLSDTPDAHKSQALHELLEREHGIPIDLQRGPMFRARIIRLGTQEHVLQLTIHHSAYDGWSRGILLSELAEAYAAELECRAPRLPELAIQYPDYAAWLRTQISGSNLDEQFDYWRRELQGWEPLELPTDHPRPAAPALQGSTCSCLLPVDVLDGLREVAGRHKGSLHMVGLAALALLLHHYTQQSDILIGTPVARRERTELERLIGMFVNTQVMRVRLAGNPTVGELLASVQQRVIDALSHQELPFEKLVEEFQPERKLGETPFVRVMYALQAAPRLDVRFPGITVTPIAFARSSTKFDLVFVLLESRDGVTVNLEYASELYSAATAERMLEHYNTILHAFATGDEGRLAQSLSLTSPDEREQLLAWGRAPVRHRRDAGLVELFAAQVRVRPAAPAVWEAGRETTYAELDVWSSQIAARLVADGVQRGTLVALYADRSAALIAGILAILKVGAGYLPLELSNPPERTALLLADGQVDVLLVESSRRAELEEVVARLGRPLTVELLEDRGGWTEPLPVVGTGPEDLAYVMYTSGSTGVPKGVAVAQRGIIRLVQSVDYVSLGPGVRMLHGASPGFDAATFEIWGALLNGGCVVVVPREVMLSPPALARLLREQRVTTGFLTSALFNQLVQEVPGVFDSMAELLFGGEAAIADVVRTALATHSRVRLSNIYGPTECTTFAVTYGLAGPPAAGARTVPIGRPITGTTAYVLDEQGQLAPIGVPGELYLGGDGVALGYWRRPELTAERFVADPFASDPDARLYRTGDVARWRGDGQLEYLGRRDGQVKVRGYRIELGEVESAIRGSGLVRDVVVVVREDVAGHKRLVGYVVAEAGAPTDAEEREGALAGVLSARLPGYMVPGAWVWLGQLPLNANGKVDRGALPVPAEVRGAGAGPVLPRNAVEAQLAGIWGEVLGVDAVGVHDNFFRLGGDSILSIQVVARAASVGLRLTARDVFQRQTVAELAAVAERATACSPLGEPGILTGPTGLLPAQVWLLEQALAAPAHFNQAILLELDERIAAPALPRIAARLEGQHDALRLRFGRDGEGGWQAWLAEPQAEPEAFVLEDLSAVAVEEQGSAIRASAERWQGCLDLESGPLWRLVQFELGGGGRRLLVVIHHLAVDGVSWRVLLEDLRVLLGDAEAALPGKTASVRQWAQQLQSWADSPELACQRAYWVAQDKVVCPALPVDDAAGADTMAEAASVSVELTVGQTRQLLTEAGRAYRTHVEELLLAALVAVLGPWTGGPRVRVLLEGHGRETEHFGEVDVSRTVGWFTSLYPVVLPVAGEIEAAICGVKEALRGVPAKGLGYGVLRYLSAEGLPAGPAAELSFNYLGQFDGALGAGPWRLAAESSGLAQGAANRRPVRISINAAVRGGQLRVSWTYSREVYAEGTIRRLAEQYRQALEGVVRHCTEAGVGCWTPSDFPLAALSPAELGRLVAAYPDLEDVYPLAPLQGGLLFHHVADPGGGAYCEQWSCRLEGGVDVAALERAWATVLQRHAVLRTAFAWEGLSRPQQVVLRDAGLNWEAEDWSEIGEAEQARRRGVALVADRAAGFDLRRAPLWRVRLTRLGTGSYELHWTFSHLLLDGWCVGQVLAEVGLAYAAWSAGREPVLPGRPAYREFIGWVGRQDEEAARGYWRGQVGDLEEPTGLGLERTGLWRETVRVLPDDLRGALEAVARREQVTLNTLVAGALAVVLGVYSGREEVVFGTTEALRPPEVGGVEEMVGLLINTVPQRVRIVGEQEVGSWLRELQAQQAGSRAYGYLPLAAIQGLSGVRGRELFEALLVVENYPAAKLGTAGEAPAGAVAGPRSVGSQMREQANYPLTLVVTVRGSLALKALHALPEESVAALLGQLEQVLRGLVAGGTVSDLHLLEEAGQAQVLRWSGRPKLAAYPEQALTELFAAQVRAHPERVAVVCGAEQWTYAQLNAQANRLAWKLLELGVGRDVPVGLCLPRSIARIVGVLGIVKAGGAYVPVEGADPAARQRLLLEDTGVAVLVTDARSSVRSVFGGVVVDIDAPELAHQPAADPPVRSGLEDLAYITYTSGSTGVPKGVAVVQRGVVRLVFGQAYAEFGPEEVFLHLAPLAFDASTLELWGALLHGGRLVVYPEGPLTTGGLGRVLSAGGVTTLWLTAALYNAVVDEDPQVLRGLRQLLMGGEALSVAHVRRGLAALPQTQLINGYGPTENTTFSCCWRIPRELPAGAAQVPIGLPVAGTTVYVVDGWGRLVPPGVSGELWLGGVGLARGYWRDAELTERKFREVDFQGRERVYRTGDRVRWTSDGVLEFLGRRDGQVKIRGFRIEVGEVEKRLGALGGVGQAVVVCREDVPGQKRLVGYYTGPAEAEELLAQLREELPEYLVPAALVALAALPVTANGKVDRGALPAPECGGLEAYVAPRSAVEGRLAEIWSAVLQVARVGVHENFFGLGGDSILSLQIVSRAQAAGLALSPRDLFSHPTIAQLAQVTKERSAVLAAADESPGVPVPLLPMQGWLFGQELAAPGHFNQAVWLELRQAVTTEQVRAALAALVAAHGALRLRFTRAGDGWQAQYGAAEASWALDVAETVTPVELERVQGRLDLGKGPLLRGLLVPGAAERPARLLVVVHHLVVDGVSWRVLLGDLQAALGQARRPGGIELPAASTSVGTWAQHLAAWEIGEQTRAYWRGVPAAAPLPVEAPAGSNRSADVEGLAFELEAEATTVLLQELPRVARAQVPEVLLTALARALGPLCGGQPLVVDVEGHGREALFDGLDLSRTVGWFTSLYPVVLPSAPVTLGAVKDVLRAVPDGGLSYGVLRQRGEELPAGGAVCFNYLGQLDRGVSAGELVPLRESAGPLSSGRNRRTHEWTVTAAVQGGRLRVHWAFSVARWRPATIAALLRRYEQELTALLAEAQQAGAGCWTPGDFPLARVSGEQLAALVARYPELEDLYPLAPLQQGMLFHSVAAPESGVFVTQFAFRLTGRMDAAAWRAAWAAVVARHAILRTAFVWEGSDELLQVVLREVALPWREEDWRARPRAEQEQALAALRVAEREAGLPLDRAPLMRLVWVRTGAEEGEFIWTHHHLLLDGWSWPLVLQEVLQLYRSQTEHEGVTLPARPAYRDYLAWLQRQDRGAAEAFWQSYLAGRDGPTRLRVDRGAAERHATGASAEQKVALSAAQTARLRAFARGHELTLNTLVQAAWGLLLARHSGEADVVFGVTRAGRPPELPGADAMIGLFINTLPLRLQVNPQTPVTTFLHQTQQNLLETQKFEYVPLSQVQNWVHSKGGDPLFETITVFENYPVDRALRDRRGRQEIRVSGTYERTNFPLTLVALPTETLSFRLSYDRGRLADEVVAGLGQQLVTVLEQLAGDASRTLGEIGLASVAERTRVLQTFNATQRPYPRDVCLPELIAAQVQRTPDHPAVQFEDQVWTYAELDAWTNRLARRLVAAGVGPETRVGVCLERSREMVGALVAVLKAGGAYVPLVPDEPAERLRFVAADAQTPVIVTTAVLAERFPWLNTAETTVIELDREGEALAQESAEPIATGVLAEHAAYMIYTSGSTGRPKGVLNAHRGIVNRLLWMQETYELTSADVVLQKTPMGFDVSVWEFFWPLLTGARLVVARPGGHQDPEYLRDLIATAGVTTLHFVPTMLGAFLETPALERCGSLKRVICSGEALSYELQEQFFARLPCELHNLYGPTEAAVDVTAYACERGSSRCSVPIGRPVANTQIYVLDSAGQPVPVGVPGELCIGGVQVARGYWRRPELTAARFVPDPFATDPGARLYRTGDLARWLPDGNLEFLGRLDEQVKLRGVRIELGEIEAVLGRHPEVAQAAVVVREDVPGVKRLVAYVVLRDGEFEAAELRSYLQGHLPEAMVPAAYVRLEALPRTPSGKTDRRALPAPGEADTGVRGTEYVAPGTDREQALAAIWSQVLGRERIGIHDDFFALGGDSILSLQIVARARKAGLHITPKQVFDHPTIERLAQVADQHSSTAAEQGPVTGRMALSPAQHYFLELGLAEPDHFNQAVVLDVAPEIPVHDLKRALEALVAHHDMLRGRLRHDDEGRQIEIVSDDPNACELTQWSDDSEHDADAAFAKLVAPLHAAIDTERGPLLAAALIERRRKQGRRLVIVIHHLAVDAVSWRILIEDLELVLAQLRAGRPIRLPPKTTSVRDWVAFLQTHADSAETRAELTHWRWAADGTGVEARVKRPMACGANCREFEDRVARVLDTAMTKRLLETGQRGASAEEVLLAALAWAHRDWTGGAELQLDLESHGRDAARDSIDLSRTVGWFTSIYPVRIEIGATDAPDEILQRVCEQMRAVPRRGVGFGMLKYFAGGSGDAQLRSAARPSISFNYLGQFDQVMRRDGLLRPAPESAGPTSHARNARPHVLDVSALVTGGQMRVVISFSRRLHERLALERLVDHLIERLKVLATTAVRSQRLGLAGFPLARLDRATLDQLLNLFADYGVEDVYPLTPLQEGMLLHSVAGQGPAVFVTQIAWRARGVNAAALRAAWQAVVARHPILRSAFVREGLPRAHQVVCARAAVPWREEDWSHLPLDERLRRLDALRRDERETPFDLLRPPVMRFALVRLGEDEYEVVWSHHHSLLDGWSVPRIVREVAALYDARRRGATDPPLPTVRPYRDYVEWLERQDLAEAERYWRDALAGFAEPTPLPQTGGVTRHAPAATGYAVQRRRLTARDTVRIEAFARAQRLTLSSLVQGAWAILLSGYAGKQELVYGVTSSGRAAELDGIEQMIGVFINTLPMRIRLVDESALAWLNRIQQQQLELQQREYSPLMKVQQWSDVRGGQPLFDSIFVFENFPTREEAASSGAGDGAAGVSSYEQANYPLALVVHPGRELSLKLCFNTPELDTATAMRLLGQLESLLVQLAEQPERCVQDFTLLTPAQQQTVLVEWNQTATEFPRDRCVHELVTEQARQHPDTPAVRWGDQCLTYRELEVRANRLAHLLRRRGVGPDSPVGVYLERTGELIVALLGILKAGGAYVPLDLDYPAERLAYMVEDAKLSTVLTTAALRGRFEPALDRLPNVELLALDDAIDVLAAQPTEPPLNFARAESLAYVIYTSGSTGRPKGVAVPHRAIVRLVRDTNYVQLRPSDVVIQAANASFDAATFEIWGPLLCGGQIVCVERDVTVDPQAFTRALRECGATTLFLTTALFNQLAREIPGAFARLRYLLFGGEAVDPRWVRAVLRDGKPEHLLHVYGPTETTTFATYYEVKEVPEDHATVPIGRPIANTTAYVLDERMRPTPIGAIGELYLGGPGLARGYWNSPALTTSKFVPNPFSDDPRARLYRTGDHVRYLDTGDIEFVGRVDQQVKIRGFRIEPDEIASTLRTHPAVRESIVVVREDEPGQKRLVAYYAGENGSGPTATELIAYLRERLPEYMIPAGWVLLERLPLTANGKVDRAALPPPDGHAAGAEEAAPPRDEVEQRVAAVWESVLKMPQVGRHDNFFDLGGHSLLLTEVQRGLAKTFGQAPTIVELFRYPTVAAMAEYFRGTPASASDRREDGSDRRAQVSAGASRLAALQRRTVTPRQDGP